MPKGIRNFPGPCDPRIEHGGPCFCFEGFANLYPAAWQYQVDVVNAPAPFDAWNGSHVVVWKHKILTPYNEALWEVEYPTARALRLFKWWEEPLADPPTFSWGLEFEDLDAIPPYSFGNGQEVTEPLPTDLLPAFSMEVHVPAWTWPIRVDPRPWDYDLP